MKNQPTHDLSYSDQLRLKEYEMHKELRNQDRIQKVLIYLSVFIISGMVIALILI